MKSITCSIGTRTGLAAVIAGMLLGAVFAVTADLRICVILIPLGLLDHLYDRYQEKRVQRRARRRAPGRHTRTAEARNTPAERALWDESAVHELTEDSKLPGREMQSACGYPPPGSRRRLRPCEVTGTGPAPRLGASEDVPA